MEREIIVGASKEAKKAEAVKRLKSTGLFYQAVEQFEKENLVNISEPPMGGLYWTDGDPVASVIKVFEANNNALVYHVIRSFTTLGQMDCLMYVSDYPEEWPMDTVDMKDNCTLAYIYDYDEPLFSEFGTIGYELLSSGGLKRTW